jgi:hypothetical protein
MPRGSEGKKSAGRSGGKTASRAARGTSAKRTTGAPKKVATMQRQPARSTARATAHTTTDHDEIRQWAEERGASPACVRRTGGDGDVGMIRLDFPGYSGAQSLEHISWDEWFQKFDESNLALVYQETTARGQKSNFNKLIGRETADKRAQGETKASRRHPERATKSSRKKAA